ncbi:MAG TPA: peptidase U32 family protein, partial [Deltaproteobacteria bacterium]|nr:peptidase U32 family protein [Deltaproteobacteria bacterium]
MTRLELLAPARDLECAIAAIDHGADAVYIGGPSFSARKAASNPMAHIERLARHAHRFHARVYLALNTILFEDELEAARKTAHEAWDAGVDGLIVQDMGLLELDLPPVPLIASTQMHNMDPEHVAFLERVGFSRVILARELSLKAIQRIRSAASIELEVFVHGALCVSFSGRCYLSASMGGRSANRGECGQPCRLPWTLRDDRGRPLTQGLHLLSLKD